MIVTTAAPDSSGRVMGSSTLRFPDALKAEALEYADELGVSLNALCALALRDYLDASKGQGLEASCQGGFTA